MRLLFVCPDMHRGGAERQWATLIPALARRGAEVRLLCLHDEGPLYGELRAAGVPANCLHLRRRGGLRRLGRVLGEAAGRPDAVVTRTISPQLAGQAIAARAGAVHVYNEHTPLTTAGELVPTPLRQRVVSRLVAPWVDGVITVTAAQKPPLVRLGYRAQRIRTVHNGVLSSDVRTSADRHASRAALGLDESEFAVLCVANLRPEKGVQAFVEAVWRAREDGVSHLRGFIAGDGPQRERMESLVASRPGVELLGSRGDVPDLLEGCDALALLSEAEALPMSILEAMALARPVLCTAVGGNAELVLDGETGIVVTARDPGAAAAGLARLAGERAGAQAMGERGRARQRERFSGELMVDGYLRALGELVRR